MQQLFPAYYRPSDDEFNEIFRRAIFVFDTNYLLDLYRYDEESRQRFLKVLRDLKKQLWMPHQIAYEYQRNRAEVIIEQMNAYDQAISTIRELQSNFDKDAKKIVERHPFIDRNELMAKIGSGYTEVTDELSKKKGQHPNWLGDDPIRTEIDKLYASKIGPAYSKEQLETHYQTGKDRYLHDIPPGYKDDKPEPDKYGDLILWFQILDYTSEKKCPAILVTRDRKEDWWYKISGKTIGPRVELLDEFSKRTGEHFYLYESSNFPNVIQSYLNIMDDDVRNMEEAVRGIQQAEKVRGIKFTKIQIPLGEFRASETPLEDDDSTSVDLSAYALNILGTIVSLRKYLGGEEALQNGSEFAQLRNIMADLERQTRSLSTNIIGRKDEALEKWTKTSSAQLDIALLQARATGVRLQIDGFRLSGFDFSNITYERIYYFLDKLEVLVDKITSELT